jgi:hypothetical protein
MWAESKMWDLAAVELEDALRMSADEAIAAARKATADRIS